MSALKTPGRLEYLDGLRAVAALIVVFFHYFQRFPAYYPYPAVPISRYLPLGWIGVWLFFVISGFVISLTLHRCASLYEFAVRRFARLWPAMLLCSILTYLVLQIVPASPFPVAARNFLPSLTFIDPKVFNFFGSIARPLDWMDGVYWSLYAEVQFYALIACVYFAQPRHFARNLPAVAALIVATRVGAQALGLSWIEKLFDQLLTVTLYLPLFMIGVGFYEEHVGRPARRFFLVGAIGIAAEAFITERADAPEILASVVWVLALAWLGMRTSAGRSLLSRPWITAVGAASYSLYLTHQRIGVASIHWLGELTQLRGWPALIFPIVVAVLMVQLTVQIYRRWEAPLNRGIVATLSPRNGKRAESTRTERSRDAHTG
jgi:peptidoglycan/LPS O-acetylase OafA/YrhL